MSRAGTLEKIEEEVEKLSPQDQLKLVEKLAHQLSKTAFAIKKELNWDKIYGIGKGLWGDEDAQDYVNRLREDRV